MTDANAESTSSTLPNEYVRTSLRQIKQAQAEQARIEAERTGASKTTSRLVAIFGSTITAAAIAGFAWVWTANANNERQDVEIETLSVNPPREHGHGEIGSDVRALERRVASVEASYAAIGDRLDRIESEGTARHAEVLEELRQLRAARATWGR